MNSPNEKQRPATKLAAKKIHPPDHKTPETAVKRQIIQDRMALWTNTLYAAQVQARVARAIDSAERETEAAAAAEQAIKALDELAAMLVEIAA